MLYSHQKLDVAFDEIENLPSKSIDSFFYLGRLLNLKYTDFLLK